jgi:ABC-2 type transport system ATP-binding protein
MIEVKGLSKKFGKVQALNDVSFKVEKGQIVGFLGANGAGKTTTMDILCGCSGADSGTAVIAGFDITEQPIEAKKRLGYLPDVPPLHAEMSVEDFVTYAAKLHQVPASALNARVNDTLSRLSLTDVRSRLVGNLSKGYRQRVALAQAIVHDPEVLVLDEPTEGLDPGQIVQIRELIRSLAGKHTILLSSHILSEVQNTCDRIIIINKGRIVSQGTYEELTRNHPGSHLLRLRVARDANKALSKIKTIPGIQHARLDEEHPGLNAIEIGLDSTASENTAELIAQAVISDGCGLRELASKTKSLEEVFFQATR